MSATTFTSRAHAAASTDPTTTTPDAGRSPMTWWKPLAIAGAISLVGGPLHPEAPEGASLQEGLAAMTASSGTWAVGHGLLAIAAVLVVVGLRSARRQGAWPRASRVLPFAIAAASVYAVEAALHLAAVIDHDRLAAGDWPPVTVAHLTMAVIGYPLFGAALGALALRLLPTWPVPMRAVSVAGVIGGITTALSAPLTVVGVDGANGLFPIAGTTTALWLLTAGLLGRRAARAQTAR